MLDLFDNPTSFTTTQTVSVSSSPPGVSVGASTCSGSTSVTLASNATQATFRAQHVVTASYALTATVGGFSTAVAASLTVLPGTPTLMRDMPVGTASLRAGACQQITLTRRDAFGNYAPTVARRPSR